MATMDQVRAYSGPALFSYGFRPFFLGGAIVAALTPALTALSLSGSLTLAGHYGTFAYHGHEMLFGFVGAVVAGFILTAVANWTGRLPLVGGRLIAMAGLWLAGRLAMAGVDFIGAVAAAIVDALFLLALAAVVWREVLAGKNWRNLPVCVLLTLFAVANVLWHAGMGFGSGGGAGFRVAVAVIALLLSLIGGRITPSFTLNWLKKSGKAPFDASFGKLDQAALASVGAALFAWVAAPTAQIAGGLLLLSALMLVLRLLRWRGWRAGAEPLVAILHVGYLWIPVGLALIGLSVLAPAVLPAATALHGITVGAAGVMTLAVMTRATLGHTGRALSADPATIVIYLLVNLGAAARLIAPFTLIDYTAAIGVASALWGGAFALFAVIYGRYLLSPRLAHSP